MISLKKIRSTFFSRLDSISVLLPDFSCSTANQFLSLLTRGEARVSRVQLSPFEGLLRAVGIGEEVLRQFTSEARGRRTGNKEVEEVVKVVEEEEEEDDDDDEIMVVSDSRDEKQQQQEQPQKQKQQQMQQHPRRQQEQHQQKLSHKQQQQHSQQVPRKQLQWQQQQKEQQQLRRLQLQHHKQIKKLEQQHQFQQPEQQQQQPEQQQLFPSPRPSPSPTGAASDHILSKMTRRDKLLKLKRICKRKAASESERGGAGQRHHLVCPLCGEESENLGGILLHLTTGHFLGEVELRHKTELQGSAGEGGMTRYTCWKCRKDFPFSDTLLAHYGRAHSEVLDLTLSKVLKSADSPATIMPGSVVVGKSASAIPTPKNVRGPRKKFRCPRCPLWADGASGVKQHLARVHFKEELLRDTGVMTTSPDFDPLTMTSPPSSGRDCPSCGARMATLDTFLRHVGGAHGMVMRYLRPEER